MLATPSAQDSRHLFDLRVGEIVDQLGGQQRFQQPDEGDAERRRPDDLEGLQVERNQHRRDAGQSRRHRSLAADIRHREVPDHDDRGDDDDRHQRRRHRLGKARHDQDDRHRQREQRIDQPGHVEDVRHLRGKDQDAERIDETDHHRARHEAHQPRQPGHAEGDLDDAGQDNGRQDVSNAVKLDHRADHQRDRAGRRRDHRGPPAQYRHHEAEHHGGDQRHLGIDAGDERERDHLGDQRQRRHQPGEHLANQHGG